MTNIEIEKEVQARVEFKMNELLNALKNSCDRNWQAAFQSGNPKYSNYYEAFGQMKQMLIKEMQLPTPSDEMYEIKKRANRDRAINKIMNTFYKRGERDFHQKERALVSIIEEVQKNC